MFFKIAKSHQIFKLLLSEILPPKALKIAQSGHTDFGLPNRHIQLPRLAWSQPTRRRERSRSPRRPRKTPSPSGRPQGLDMSGILLKDAWVLRYAYKNVPIGKGTWLVRVTILGLDMFGILLKDAQVLRYAYKDVPIGKGTWLVRVLDWVWTCLEYY